MKHNAVVSRFTYEISNTATAMYRQAHENVARFIGANEVDRFIEELV